MNPYDLNSVNADMTKKEIIEVLKANDITDVNGKSLRKCTKQVLLDAASPQADVVVETEEAVVVAETVQPSPEEIAEIVQMAKEIGATQEKTKSKKKGGPKGSWVTRIQALLASDNHRGEDGSYFFPIEEAAELMGVNPELKCLSVYPQDWHPCFKGPGRACIQNSVRGRLQKSKGLTLTPLSEEEAASLMEKYNYSPIT